MTDFKVHKNLNGEISGLRSAGEAISSEYKSISSSEVKTLKTSMEIIDQHKAIKELLDLYEALVIKDANDMDAYVTTANLMDKSIIGKVLAATNAALSAIEK